MSRTGSCLVLFLALPLVGQADETIPQEMLQHLKAATVFVKVRMGDLQSTGSGFLMTAENGTGLIVTNDHVVVPPKEMARRPGTPVIEVVFHSGRKNEMVIRADLIATDPERDLAVLRVKNIKDLPKPVNITDKPTLVETMGVYIFGFPFGEQLSTTRGNPAMTIGKGNVSSIREDEQGEVRVVQLDGDLNPGNSGGPVVDSKGRLVGVAVARLKGTRIGLAIPSGELTKMLNGRLKAVGFRRLKANGDTFEIGVEVLFIDPLEKITKAKLLVAKQEGIAIRTAPDAKGDWPALSNAQTVELKIADQKGTGTFTVTKGKEKGPLGYMIQPVYTTGDDRTHYAQPDKYTVPTGDEFAAGSPNAGEKPPSRGSGSRELPSPRAGGGSDKTTPKAGGSRGKPPSKMEGGTARPLGDPVITPVQLGSSPGPACLCWTTDAKAFYYLDGTGTVRRVSFPELKEEMVLETGKKCSWLCLSAAGVLLTVKDDQEMWLLDPQSLKVKTTMPIAGAQRVVSAPNLDVAYFAEVETARATLIVVNLKTMQRIKQYAQDDFERPGVNYLHPVVSNDGKLLFTTGGMEQVFRFRLDGAKVEFEEASPRLLQGRFEGLCLSQDGKYVAAPAGGGNYPLRGEQRSPYATYIYSTLSFEKPLLTIQQGAYPQAIGFDAKSGFVYAQNHEYALMVFGTDGNKLKQYKLGDGRNGVRQYLVHPEGRKLLVLGEGSRAQPESDVVMVRGTASEVTKGLAYEWDLVMPPSPGNIVC